MHPRDRDDQHPDERSDERPEPDDDDERGPNVEEPPSQGSEGGAGDLDEGDEPFSTTKS